MPVSLDYEDYDLGSMTRENAETAIDDADFVSSRFARGESGTRILKELAALSKPYGTEFTIEDSVAVVEC